MSAPEVVGVPVAVETLARAIDRHPDYRILRRIKSMRRQEPRHRRTAELTIAVVDVETTGFDHRKERIIELAVQTIGVDGHGRIVDAGESHSWLEDPGFPIPPEITRVTGLRDEDVKGKGIIEPEAWSLIDSADAVLSHNAKFDRPFVEKRLELAGNPWICSLSDIDWPEHGFREGRKLSQLLTGCGWFHEAHRAASDVNALLHLLDHRLDVGRTVLKELLVNAARPTWVVEATNAPFEAKDLLKLRGYRWAADRKIWTIEVGDDAAPGEIEWAQQYVYAGRRPPDARKVTWRERYVAAG